VQPGGGTAACQTDASGLLGLQLLQLHDLEAGGGGGTPSRDNIDAGVLSALSGEELQEHYCG
jgi:hypothetical protein